ncbi:MAG TPA: peptidoglycan DD-metalloendopeptidase family protein [Trichocoleus sp.]
MVEEPAATPGAAPEETPAGAAEQGSELEAQLEQLRAELAATRQEIRGLQGEAAQQSELEKLQASLDRARRQRDRLLNPPPPKEPKPEPTAEEILKQQLREARQQLQALKANPDKEAAELRQKLAKARRELELAQSVQSSQALQQVRAVSAEIAALKAGLQDTAVAIKRQTGWATVEAIAAEVGAVQRELGSIQSTLTLSRLQMGAVAFLLCWIAIASAEAFGLARSIYQRVAELPGIGMLAGGGDDQAQTGALPTTATPLMKGDKVARYLVTSGFGSRVPPCAGCSSNHLGVDLATPIGTPVYAPYAASVECKGGPSNPAGNYAVLKPKSGGPEFLLLHLDGCQSGEAKPGQRVGTSGNTGNGTGAHLDVRQIESGNYVNPTKEWVERIITGKVGGKIENAKLNALRQAIVGQESGGNFRAINPHSGALGYGQIMPENLPSWSRAALGREVGAAEFLNSPELQIAIINHKLGEYLQEELASGADYDTAIRRVASRWYSGQGHLYDDPTPQFYGAGSYPSIRDYTLSILEKYKAALSVPT